VTFCLADSAVAHAERRRRLENRSSALDVARFSEPAARPSDAVMSDPSLAAIVEAALLHFQGERIALHAWVVMPDHVHVVVTPLTHTLAEVIQSWKSFTAHQINRALGQSGRVWQSESFDHIVRSNDDYDRFVGYVDRNPVEAGLCAVPAEWPFSSARFRGE